VKNVTFVPYGGDKEKIAEALCTSAKTLSDPQTARVVRNVFLKHQLEILNVDLCETGVRIAFETEPDRYEDRVFCRTEMDLAHNHAFLEALQVTFDPKLAVERSISKSSRERLSRQGSKEAGAAGAVGETSAGDGAGFGGSSSSGDNAAGRGAGSSGPGGSSATGAGYF